MNLGTMPYGVLNHEIDVWLGRLNEMVDELMKLEPFIERPGLIVVPDTARCQRPGEYWVPTTLTP